MSNVIRIDKTKALDKKMQDTFESQSDNLHAYNVEYLMQNKDAAIKLQLSNLINTYGLIEVAKVLNNSIKQEISAA